MGSILKDEDSSGPVPRLRKWPRLKPIHKSSVLPHPNQPSHSIEVKPRASVEDSFKKRHEQADVESVEARRSEQPQCSDLESGQELERREVEHEAASNEVAALLRHSGVGPLKRTSSGDGVEATETNDLGWTNREGGSGELGLQDDLGSVPYSAAVQPAADLQGLRLNEGAQDTGLLCDQSEAKGRGHSELDTPSLEASAKKKRSITVVSGGSSVRSSVASVNRQPQERSRGRVSESLTDVARILNEKNGREDNSSTTVLTRRPSSARSSLRGPPGEPGGPMRRSVLTPRSNFEENGTRGKVQKVDHGTKKGAVKTQEKASALMSVSIARPLLTLASDVTSQLLKGGKSQTRRSSDLSCQATSVKAEAVGAKEARADDVAGANWETSGATEQSKRAGLDQNVSTAGALIGTTDEDDMAQSQDGLQEDTTLADTGERASSAVDNHHSAVSISSSVEEPSKSFELDRGPSSLPDEQCQPPKRLDVSDTTSIDTSAPGHHDLRDNNRPLPPARTSLSAQKLSSILKYLEEVDAGQHQYPPLPEDTAGTSVGLLGPMRMQAAHGGHRRMSTSEEGESEAGYPVDSISTASLEAASRMRGLEGSSGDASEASFLLDRTPRGATAVRSRLPERGGTGSSSPMSGSGQGPSLVASVYQVSARCHDLLLNLVQVPMSIDSDFEVVGLVCTLQGCQVRL